MACRRLFWAWDFPLWRAVARIMQFQRECDAVCLFSTEEDRKKAVSLIREMEAEIAQELREADPGFAVLTEQTSAQTKMADEVRGVDWAFDAGTERCMPDRNENAGRLHCTFAESRRYPRRTTL